MQEDKRSNLIGYLLVALAGISWGIGGLFVENLSSMGVGPSVIAFNSQAFAIIPMGLYLLFKDGIEGFKISKKSLFHTFILGMISKGFFKLVYDTSITMVGVAMGSILLYLSPIFVAIMSAIFFKERIGNIQKVALALNLIGCILMVTGGDFTRLNVSTIGIILGILAAFFYGTNSIIGRFTTDGVKPRTAAFYMFIFSSLTLLPFAQLWNVVGFYTQGDFLFQSLLYGLIPGVLANTFFLTGISMGISPSRATIFTSLEVVVATLVGVVVFNEFLNGIGLIGIVLMLLSIIIVNAGDPQLEQMENIETQ